MNAFLSMRDMFKCLLPLDCPNGWLAMLRAYFDDSGTHDASDIVLVAGIFGTEGRMDGPDRGWKKHLDRPLDGIKKPIERFHMVDCQNSMGEFAGWTRTETEYFCHQLRTTIINSGVSSFGVACSRKDWDELVTGDIRAIAGTAEGFCIRNCFIRAIDWAQSNTFDPQMTFIFDDRPSQVKRDAHVVFNAFQKKTQFPSLVGVAFLRSYKVRPLQAADMLAWEIYQHANDVLRKGFGTARREQFRHLTSNMAFLGLIATRKAIERVVAYWEKQDAEVLRRMAAHFTFFDPENPDYSYLSGEQLS